MESDKLTGLLKFDDFVDTASKILADNPTGKFVVVSTDISRFKFINYKYGYSVGNILLQDLASTFLEDERCKVAGRPYTDHAAGLFEITGMENKDFEKHIRDIQRRLVMEHKRELPDAALHLNTGICYSKDGDEAFTSLLDGANIARRSVKGDYSVPYAVYSEAMQKRFDADDRIIPIFDRALEEGTIQVYLQPKINASTHELVGSEALTRLLDEEGKIVPPDEFITVLENSGKILDLDRYVMKYVFASIKKWLDEGRQVKPVSINLSKIHFFQETVVDDIITEFEKYGISPDYIEFEVTESVFFEESSLLISQIERIRDYGFKVSVDDFGAGYSSLNLLGILPVDIIKLDKGFIKNCLGNDRGRGIIKGLIKILNEIEMDIVCEGIETSDEERTVYEFGCESMQGFLYDRPIPVSSFEDKYMQLF